LILGLGIGIPLSLFGVLYNLSHDWEMRKSLYLGRQFNLWAGPLVSLAWASLVMIIVRQARLPWLMEPLGRSGAWL